MSAIPTGLKIVDEKLEIEWSDGETRRYGFSELRNVCPCATCREQRSSDEKPAEPAAMMMLPVLSADEARPLRIEGMQPVGNYAYTIKFSDGHDTGIYTFTFLRQLGDVV